MKNFLFHTVGCRLNQADTALMTGRLKASGWKVADKKTDENISLIVINSCTVTEKARKKTSQSLRRFRRKHPNAVIIISGCSVETDSDEYLSESYADIVLSNNEKRKIIEILDNFLNGKKHTPDFDPSFRKKIKLKDDSANFAENIFSEYPFRSRASVKIQEGCNNFCSYCIVPYVRGREKSRVMPEILEEIQYHLKNKCREIVLTGVNMSTYSYKNLSLPDLLKEILRINSHFRIRLSSLEPHPINRQIIDIIAENSKICRFMHVSLQNGSDRILKKMNRNYTAEDFADFAEYARKKIPGLHLGTDVIVGFPGETEKDFKETVIFLKKINFANVHIFPYSKRKGTPAADMPNQINGDSIKKRRSELQKISEKSKTQFIKSQKGKTLPVLIEKKISKNKFEGWSDNYIRSIINGKNLKLNSIYNCEICAFDEKCGKTLYNLKNSEE